MGSGMRARFYIFLVLFLFIPSVDAAAESVLLAQANRGPT